MTKTRRVRLIKLIERQTQLFADTNGYNSDKVNGLSGRKKRIALLDYSAYGCHSHRVRELVSLLSGIPIKQLKGSRGGVNWVILAAVVPLMSENSHNYVLGSPCVIARTAIGGNTAVASSGVLGNTLGSRFSAVRPATKEEIKSLPDKQLYALEKYVAII